MTNMFESVTPVIIGIAGTLLAVIVGHVLGQLSERRKQSLAIKAEMLKPIEEYIKEAEKMVGFLADTMSSISLNLPAPVTYRFDERKKTLNFMAEKTNEVFGIVASEGLQTGKTKKLSRELGATLNEIDKLTKYQILPRESDVVDRANRRALTQEFMLECGAIKVQADDLLQKSYSLIAQIRNSLN